MGATFSAATPVWAVSTVAAKEAVLEEEVLEAEGAAAAGALEGLFAGSTGNLGGTLFSPASHSSAVIPGTVHLVSGKRSS